MAVFSSDPSGLRVQITEPDDPPQSGELPHTLGRQMPSKRGQPAPPVEKHGITFHKWPTVPCGADHLCERLCIIAHVGRGGFAGPSNSWRSLVTGLRRRVGSTFISQTRRRPRISYRRAKAQRSLRSYSEDNMDTTTLLIIIIIVLLVGGGGWYGRGRWF